MYKYPAESCPGDFNSGDYRFRQISESVQFRDFERNNIWFSPPFLLAGRRNVCLQFLSGQQPRETFLFEFANKTFKKKNPPPPSSSLYGGAAAAARPKLAVGVSVCSARPCVNWQLGYLKESLEIVRRDACVSRHNSAPEEHLSSVSPRARAPGGRTCVPEARMLGQLTPELIIVVKSTFLSILMYMTEDRCNGVGDKKDQHSSWTQHRSSFGTQVTECFEVFPDIKRKRMDRFTSGWPRQVDRLHPQHQPLVTTIFSATFQSSDRLLKWFFRNSETSDTSNPMSAFRGASQTMTERRSRAKQRRDLTRELLLYGVGRLISMADTTINDKQASYCGIAFMRRSYWLPHSVAATNGRPNQSLPYLLDAL
ncbi:hypothetical protein J6590_028870 [Homalodisca vitripennis]|nr:hypothetical protein J6590_028870 [Homalodisca vitripennis]